jgi:LmbE family N-acetylglucosaminyl deacetylase
MLDLSLNKKEGLKVLCLGAHSDDIEIGCGGTVLKLLESHSRVEVYWVVFSALGKRRLEAKEGANCFLRGAEKKTVALKNFKMSFFPFVGDRIKGYFEELKQKCSPDLIFTHTRQDLHQDHQMISLLTWNSFRNHLILEYEIPKYDGDLGTPNFFVPLNEAIRKTKVEYILNSFKTQKEKHWFTESTFSSILRLRGVESNAPGGYAEAFYCRKIVLG